MKILGVVGTNECFEQGVYIPPPMEESGAPFKSLIELELVFAPQVAYRVYDEFDEGLLKGQIMVHSMFLCAYRKMTGCTAI